MNDIEENLLRRIKGEYISAAIKALPNAEGASGDFQENVIEVPGLGKVRFTCRRVKSRHHKSSNVFWSAIAAVKIE